RMALFQDLRPYEVGECAAGGQQIAKFVRDRPLDRRAEASALAFYRPEIWFSIRRVAAPLAYGLVESAECFAERVRCFAVALGHVADRLVKCLPRDDFTRSAVHNVLGEEH